jgi:cytochrome c peroxidase
MNFEGMVAGEDTMVGLKRMKPERLYRAVALLSLLFCSHTSFAGIGKDSLLTEARQIFGVLPRVIVSENNPVTPEKVMLGKILFYETRLSVDDTVSCVRCHPFGLYAADGLKKSIGNNCKINPRNAPTVLNAAGQISAHWIGNRLDVEDQAKQALVGPPSFGMPSYEAAEKKLKAIRGYGPLFKKAFPGDPDPVTLDHFAKAVGAFERTLLTPSDFDVFLKGKGTALTAGQKQGLKIFMETGCISCHGGPYLGGQIYQKFGLLEPYWKQTGSKEIDDGRYGVTKNESDRFVFKVPVLRNVEKTSPYFHDGSVDRLDDAVRIMGKIQLGKTLEDRQIRDMVIFFRSLTGKIPDDVLKVPLLPPNE